MIDEDKDILISLVKEIKDTGQYGFEKMTDDEEMSFFRDASKDMIREYSFATPIELHDQLTSLWNQLNNEDFHKLTDVITVLAFKHRGNSNSSENISSYIYEM